MSQPPHNPLSPSGLETPCRDRLDALGKGDPEAWRSLLQEFGGLIRSIGVQFRLDSDARDDLLQNVCLRLHTRVDTITDPDRLSSWIYTVAVNEAKLILRKQRAWSSLDDPNSGTSILDIQGNEPPPDELAAALIASEHVRTAVSRLEGRCHDLLIALYLHEPPMDYQQITEDLGIPVGSIGPTRARCLRRLALQLKEVSRRGPADSTEQTEDA